MIAALLETKALLAIEQIPIALRKIRDALRDSQKPINALGPDGNDATLCGLTAEKIVASRKDWHPEDDTELVMTLMRTNRKVTCWYCANTIRHCVVLGTKAIGRVREGGDLA